MATDLDMGLDGQSGLCTGWASLMQPRGLTVWKLADGTVPDLSCEKCGRPTPMLVHGLGFDCCDPNRPEQSE